MRFFFDTGAPSEPSPIIRTRVLNSKECGIVVVGCTITGKLCYGEHWIGKRMYGIEKVQFVQSKRHRRREQACQVEADFDIYTTDGRVIEVNSCDRRLIEAAVRYAPVYDIRRRFRSARGV